LTSVGTNLPDDLDETKSIRPATLIQLHKLGFKLVPLSLNHKPVVDWTPIYENSEYWSEEKLIAKWPIFENVATAFGKTHVKDSDGKDLYLNELDCDSEPVYKTLTTLIDEISDAGLKSKLLRLCSEFGVWHTTAGRKISLLDILKEITVIVKTRKPYGYKVFWFSHIQHDYIGTKKCKPGHEFEIKTNNSLGLSTLPPSTHRDDQTFRYSYTGRTDKIEAIDELHSIFIGSFKECLISDPTKVNGNDNDNVNGDNRSRDKKQATTTTTSLYDLSEQMKQTTVAYFVPYYIVGRRHDFALCFSGAAWYAKISEDSADKILSQIATNTNDDEIQSRLTTLHATYEKATKEEPVTGGPTLVELISAINGCELEEARGIVASIRSLWHDDIQRQRKCKQQTVRDSNRLISVSDAIRLKEGPVNVAGKIVGMNVVQPMISQIHVLCKECSNNILTLDHRSQQVWRSSIKYHRKYCLSCSAETDIITDPEYTISLEIQVQDLEKINNVEQLTAIVFEQDTEGIQFNDIVNLKGNLHVVRKYDNPSNRLQSILFVESIEGEGNYV